MQLQRKLIPEAVELLERRYSLLRIIGLEGPVGRRTLAQRTGLAERLVRTETEFLKSRGFLEHLTKGMVLTGEGRGILEELHDQMHDFLKMEEFAGRLKEQLHFDKVILVPGDCDEDPQVLDEAGLKAASELLLMLKNRSVVALTGGNTIKKMVEQFPAAGHFANVTVVPARGGVGRHYDIQSNTLAGRLAEKLGGSYRLLNLPDTISEQALDAMVREKEVKETLDLIRRADIVVAGVGDALTMAERRDLSMDQTKELINLGARGEFFGSYYDENQRIVKQSLTVGLSLKEVAGAKQVIVLACGTSKAKAIMSVDFKGLRATLITDEGAARCIAQMSQDTEIKEQPSKSDDYPGGIKDGSD